MDTGDGDGHAGDGDGDEIRKQQKADMGIR